MGKRKDRRAMGASRRFKLDLFADPSDLSLQEGARDNLNHGGETGVPDSPTSGEKENPLSLLSQYTDEDSDEDEMERPSDRTMAGSVPNGQITENTVETDKAGNSLQEIAPATIKDLKHGDDQIENVSKEVEATVTEQLATENQITQSSSCEPVMQTISDAGGDWKMVMHAETNQCYYWNTLTGETSWEVPAGLVLTVPNDVAASDNATCTEAGRGVSELVEPGSLPLECQMSGFEDTGLPAKSYPVATEEDKGVNGGTTFSEDFDPDKLVKYGEDLLERLKLLDGSSTQIDKIKEEIEIRTSDCKELKPYGMSLFPFWLHTQSKLSCLETNIKNAEVSLSKSSPDSTEEEVEKETYATLSSFGTSNQKPENGEERENEEMEMEIGHGENGKENEEQEVGKEQDDNGKEKVEKEMEREQEKEKEKEEVREEETILPIEDVEMEIDEENIVTDVTNTKNELPLTSLEEGEVPPPPLPLPDDWAPPPPPPEDEPVPPPPEDEVVPPPPPEEPSVSYSVAEAIPPYQNYMAVPSYDYSAANGYTQPHYYQAYYTASAQLSAPVSGAVAQAVTANGMVEPAVYNYAVPAGQRAAEIPNKPECSLSVYPPGSYVGTANEILVSSASQAVGSVHVSGNSLVSRSSDAASSAVVSSIGASSAAATSAAASLVAIPSGAATSSAVPPAVSKDQPKAVVKSKKRSIAVASTLRSNKKVASLVNKWNAAKEELHGDDDDEPESAYEALERKRQKAIESWRLHQLTSGEAQDNANFVPLGGDWRERVKRKRANKETKMKDLTETSPDATTAATTVIENEKLKGQEQLDLGQLSIGLPSGWQAYWDESSKQVYYGNASTSETSWVRPI
ncbi:WW domain-containing protein isoform X3 [Carex rostrata]